MGHLWEDFTATTEARWTTGPGANTRGALDNSWNDFVDHTLEGFHLILDSTTDMTRLCMLQYTGTSTVQYLLRVSVVYGHL